jgi:hypothetical protein
MWSGANRAHDEPDQTGERPEHERAGHRGFYRSVVRVR